MPENTFTMEVACGGIVNRIMFATMEAAQAQLALIEPKIGERFTNAPDMRRHRITGDDGSIVVSMGEVTSARVVDLAVFNQLSRYAADAEVAFEARKAEASQAKQSVGTDPLQTND